MTADRASNSPTCSPLDASPDDPVELDPAVWIDDHADALFRYALPRVRDRNVAEDLVQETFLAAIEAKDRFAGRSSVRTWLTAILRNKIVDHIRQAPRHGAKTVADDDIGGLEAVIDERGVWRHEPGDWPGARLSPAERDELRRAIDHCAATLPPALFDVFVLREMEQMDTGSTCQVLDISPTNLWTRVHRMRMMLRKCLEQRWLDRGSAVPPE